MLLSGILKDSNYKLSQFREDKIQELESRIVERDNKYFVNCLIRRKEIRLTPEEAIRQLYVKRIGLCPKRDDYPIFFATMQEPSKDNSGEYQKVK